MPNSLYMLGEHFKNKGAAAVCRRFRDRGRMAPEGRTYLSSWVDEILRAAIGCMATEDPSLLDKWMANWSDLVNFEVHAVVTSQEAAESIEPRL
ncbi:MAG: DUF3303 family protein [Candidatus Acidiferrum sp.]